MRPMRLSCVQMAVRFSETAANVDAIAGHIADEGARRADLVVFPECATSGYVFADVEEATRASVRLDGPEIEVLVAACRRAATTAAVGVLERAPEGHLHNSVAFISGRGVIGVYRKTHLPHMGVDRFVKPGLVLSPEVVVAGVRVAALVCYDGTFPEPARALALRGAELLLLPTNWPNQESEKGTFLPPTRALENVVWFAAVNRSGPERGIDFLGNSSICDPGGRRVAVAGTEPEILRAEIDPAEARRKRRDTVPGELWVDRFADRRPALYGRLVDGGASPDFQPSPRT